MLRIWNALPLLLAVVAGCVEAAPPPAPDQTHESAVFVPEEEDCPTRLGACYTACEHGSASGACFKRCDAEFLRCLDTAEAPTDVVD